MRETTAPTLLGFTFDPIDLRSAVARCVGWCTGERATHTVITANSSHLCMARRDDRLRSACKGGDLTLADGMSIVWALKAAGTPVPERVAGVDLMAHLLAAAGERGLRVYFLGARREVVTTLARQSERKYPGLVVAGVRDGYFSSADHAAIIDDIRASAPHLLFVGMPSPFKETWVQHNRAQLNVPVVVGVGGSFDVLAGYLRRAPRWLQAAGLEWLWRLLMEPRKLWKRYLTLNSEFIWLAGREILKRRFGRPLPAEGTQADANA